ncbi:MAG: DUF4292 domain-containing protein [Muribaculaceae bacterium]|nr:DUF4292 domain-containing protein [Muribaculaceae bacterium]
MKKILRITLFAALLTLGLAGCRSSKNATEVPDTVQPSVVETPQWNNVTFPVRVNIIQPLGISLNGTATLVRDQYVYVSMRMLGFEVAQFYVTPGGIDLVAKQPQKMWVEEPMGDRLKSADVDFLTIQEALLGNREAQAKLPASLQCGGSETAPQFRLQTKLKNMQVDVVLDCQLADARWNVERPANFSAPSGIAKTTLQNAAGSLGR